MLKIIRLVIICFAVCHISLSFRRKRVLLCQTTLNNNYGSAKHLKITSFMKTLKIFAILLMGFAFTNQAMAEKAEKKTADDAWEMVSQMNDFDEQAVRDAVEGLNTVERSKLIKMAIKDVKQAKEAGITDAGAGMYILAVFIPWLAVGLHTDWGIETLYNILWCFLLYLPGVIHAFIVLGR